MRQQVNLLDPELLPKREKFPSSLILLTPLVVLIGLLVLYGYARWELGELRKGLTTLTEQEAVLLSQLELTSKEFPRQEKDPELEQRIQALSDEKALKVRVLETLKGRTLSNTEGFAGYLEAIAGHWPDGLWLKTLSIDDAGGQLRLTGFATTATLPPNLVANLAKSPKLAGVSFRTFRITRPKGDVGALRFELDTRRTAAPKEEVVERPRTAMEIADSMIGGGSRSPQVAFRGTTR